MAWLATGPVYTFVGGYVCGNGTADGGDMVYAVGDVDGCVYVAAGIGVAGYGVGATSRVCPSGTRYEYAASLTAGFCCG